MKQMEIPSSVKVDIDFEKEHLSKAVKDFRPAVWQDSQGYSCLLGPDPQQGISGYGSTIEEALANWEVHLRERTNTAGPADDISQYVIDVLKISKKDVG